MLNSRCEGGEKKRVSMSLSDLLLLVLCSLGSFKAGPDGGCGQRWHGGESNESTQEWRSPDSLTGWSSSHLSVTQGRFSLQSKTGTTEAAFIRPCSVEYTQHSLHHNQRDTCFIYIWWKCLWTPAWLWLKYKHQQRTKPILWVYLFRFFLLCLFIYFYMVSKLISLVLQSTELHSSILPHL